MQFSEIHRLLHPDPLRLEMGVERLADGVLHVAARTDMYHTKGRMFEWWYGYFTNSQEYVWWHPADHVYLRWDDRYKPGDPLGATCVVDERLCTSEVYRLFIYFVDPKEIFSSEALDVARRSGDVSGVITAQIGIGDNPPMTTDGSNRPLGSRVVHVVRDTPFGSVLRSHFYLGLDLAGQLSPQEIEALVPEEIGLRLMKHAYTEFTFLSRFLPSLFIAENRGLEAVPLPW